jgi:GNAT superfamily N-acetyltransferase
VTTAAEDLVIRRAGSADRPAILALMAASLGWTDDARHAELFAWKHDQNPFGPSPAWVATDRGRLLGFRTFMRWRFTWRGRAISAVRAVDTATHPDARGKGLFKTLTMQALAELRDEGVDWVFNTPNDQSRPGYLKMGWQEVGRLSLGVRPALRVRSLVSTARSRSAHADLWPEREGDAVALDEAASVAAELRCEPADCVTTDADAAYFRWRFGLGSLGYRVVAHPSGIERGCAFVRCRRRGAALETSVCEITVRDGDGRAASTVIREALRATGGDVAAALGAAPGMLSLRNRGPLLTARAMGTEPPLGVNAWALSLGDIELF